MSGIIRPAGAGLLHTISLHRYGLQLTLQGRPMCKLPPHGSKLVEEANTSVKEKDQEQLEEKVVTDQEIAPSRAKDDTIVSTQETASATTRDETLTVQEIAPSTIKDDTVATAQEIAPSAGSLQEQVTRTDVTEQQVLESVATESQESTQVNNSVSESKQKEVENIKSPAMKINDLLKSLASIEAVPAEAVKVKHTVAKQGKRNDRFKKERSESIDTTVSEAVQPKLLKVQESVQTKSQSVDTAVPVPPEEIVIEPELVAATKDVAKSLGGNVEVTESELLANLRLHTTTASSKAETTRNISDLIMGMKIEQNESDIPKQTTSQRKQKYQSRPQHTMRPTYITKPAMKHGKLFGAKRLDIFSKVGEGQLPIPPLLPTWNEAQKQDLLQHVAQPPSNGFVEMIMWTNQGKLWNFPIDNEVGFEEEKQIGFHEHVFLERHLEDWCPRRGPIRHFMELVCTGLSKNPYITVERKKAHIKWYENYFAEKEELLKEIGAIEAAGNA